MPRAVAAWLIGSLAVTIAAYGWISIQRAEVFDPADLLIYMRLVIFGDYWASLTFPLVLLAGLVPALRRSGLAACSGLGGSPALISVGLATSLAWASVVVYHAHPLSMDEYSPVFQARIFGDAQMSAVFPGGMLDWLVPTGFQGVFLAVDHESGRVASQYWPGFALLLTPFESLGVSWLLNPLIGGAGFWLVGHITRELGGDSKVAGLAGLLALGSPAFAANAISYYSMTAHLVCNLAFVALLLKPTPIRACGAGIVGSVALALHNPLPHLLFALPWGLWLASQVRIRPALLLSAGLGYLPLSALLVVGWPLWLSAQFASPVLPSIPFVIPTPDLLTTRILGLVKLWLWAVPGLVLLAVLGARRCRQDARVRLMFWSAVATFVGYLFVPFDQGHGWGFRYFHSAWGVLPILGALAVVQAQRPDRVPCTAADGLLGVAAAVSLASLLTQVPLRGLEIHRFIEQHLAQMPAGWGGAQEVVIVNGINGYYAWDLVQNDPQLRGRVILASHGLVADAAMMAVYFPSHLLDRSSYRGQVWRRQAPGRRPDSLPSTKEKAPP